MNVLALEFPPVNHLFDWPSIAFEGTPFALNKVGLTYLFAMVATMAIFALAGARRGRLVPAGVQHVAESGVNFVEESVVMQTIGPDGKKFMPFLTTMFFFILFSNITEVIPGWQFPANSRMAMPITLALPDVTVEGADHAHRDRGLRVGQQIAEGRPDGDGPFADLQVVGVAFHLDAVPDLAQLARHAPEHLPALLVELGGTGGEQDVLGQVHPDAVAELLDLHLAAGELGLELLQDLRRVVDRAVVDEDRFRQRDRRPTIHELAAHLTERLDQIAKVRGALVDRDDDGQVDLLGQGRSGRLLGSRTAERMHERRSHGTTSSWGHNPLRT